MKRNPHPARASRITTLGVSATAFVSIVTSLAWNTHQAELAAAAVDATVLPVGQTIPVTGIASPVLPSTTTSVTAAPAIAPAASGVSANGSTAATPAKANKSTTQAAPKVSPATPSVPAKPVTAAVAPAAPAATVIYTCMSPGGKTETPSTSGQCKNAKYGYVLTQI